MPRQPTLRKHSGQWFTQAGGGPGTYFGPVAKVSYADAKKAFAKHLETISAFRLRSEAVAILIDSFLDAVQKHRVDRSYRERKLHLERFANFRIGGYLIGELSATSMKAEYMTAFLEHVRKEYDLDEITCHKHFTSINACFNWGAGRTRLKNPSPSLPSSFWPFGGVERWKAPPNELHEDELPTVDEIKALMQWADTDLAPVYENGKWRQRRPEERRTGEDNPYRGFQDLLKMYYHTGARTSELAACNVHDVTHGSRQIVLGKHKRSQTMRDAVSRRLTLNDEAHAIVKRWCRGKKPDDPVFTDPPQYDRRGQPNRSGRRWARETLGRRFLQIRNLAGVRPEITLYSFRHLWISEALMSGTDIATVAKMAGTSVLMIERVYGHFRAEHLQEAQRRLDDARRTKAKLSA